MNERNLIIISRRKFNHCVNNFNLSWKAKGIHSYLVSRPEVWEIRHSDLFNRSIDGMESTTVGLGELLKLRYIYRIYKNSGHGMDWGYLVFETPIPKEDAQKELEEARPEYSIKEMVAQNPDSVKPTTVKPVSGEHHNKGNKGIKEVNNELRNKGKIINDSSKDEYVLPQGATQVPKKLKRRITKEIISTGLKQQSKTTLEPVKIIAPKIKDILDFHSSTLHKYRSDSEAYFKSAKAIQSLMKGIIFNGLNGKFVKYHNRPFTCEEIKGVLERILIASSPDYYPPDKRWLKQSFDQLVYNPRISNGDFKSNFLYYFENEPKHYGNGVSLIDDPDEDITTTFKSIYEESVVAGNKKNFNNVEENKFRTGAQKALEFYKNNRERMHIHNKRTYIREVWEAITKFNSLDKIYPGTFCSSKTWEHDVPVYLADQGILEQVRVL